MASREFNSSSRGRSINLKLIRQIAQHDHRKVDPLTVHSKAAREVDDLARRYLSLLPRPCRKRCRSRFRRWATSRLTRRFPSKARLPACSRKPTSKKGENVKKGQLLFTIDPRPYDAALKQAEANLARDTAQLQNSREQARRYAELVKKQYVSQEQYDQIRANADAAEAVVQADQAAVENAKVQLSYCYIFSPIDGQVGTLLVNEGNLVRVNDGTPLVVINQVTPIYVTFSVPEQNLADMRRHMAAGTLKVEARFPSDEGRPEQGSLAFIDNAVDRTTGTIKLKAEFQKP